MTTPKWLMAFVAIAALLSATAARAQWVMVARAVSRRIQQMATKPSKGTGFDVATVVLEANADKVYETAVKSLQNHAEIIITDENAKKREVKFAKGDQVASLQATPLGDKLTQLVIASNLTEAQPSPTSLVVQGVLKVCTDMHVSCRLDQNYYSAS
jgi:hypothetical protein